MFKGGMAGMLQKAKQMQEDMKIAQQEIKLISCQGVAASGQSRLTSAGIIKQLALRLMMAY